MADNPLFKKLKLKPGQVAQSITLVSIDDTWSAFSLRPYKPGEDRQPFR